MRWQALCTQIDALRTSQHMQLYYDCARELLAGVWVAHVAMQEALCKKRVRMRLHVLGVASEGRSALVAVERCPALGRELRQVDALSGQLLRFALASTSGSAPGRRSAAVAISVGDLLVCKRSEF